MGEQKGPDFYDEHLERVGLPLEKSPWRETYQAAASLLPDPASAAKIVDVACGTGRFAKLLLARGQRNYLGFDFSAKRIEEARRYVPELRFEVADAFGAQARGWVQGADVVVMLEVLEHLEDDLELVAAVTPGTTTVLSVPTYDSAAHVRSFSSAEAAVNRYEGLLRFNIEPVVHTLRSDRRIFVLRGTRVDD